MRLTSNLEMVNLGAGEPSKEFREAFVSSPFTIAAEDLFRYYFFHYWRKTGRIPRCSGVARRVERTEWYVQGNYKQMTEIEYIMLHQQCQKEIT